MKKIFGVLVLSLFSFYSCSVNVENDLPFNVGEEPVVIKDHIARGMLDSQIEFVYSSALCKQEVSFNKKGYMFYLDEESINCEEKVLITPVSFFIESQGPLEVGAYTGNGPYIHSPNSSSSFFGCDVIITKITDSTIEAKVKGGNDTQYIEGKFTAVFCNN